MNNQRRFENKIVLVTGGNSGIGLASAKRFATEGAQVIITGRDEKTLRSAQQEIGSAATAIAADVSRLADLDNLYREIGAKFGRLDVIFANTGIAEFALLEQTSEEFYDGLMNVNVKGVFYTVQKALGLLSNPSAIVINGSIASIKGQATDGIYASVYGATKAAVRSFARSFSAELIGRGVRTNVVSPGPIETPIWSRNPDAPEEMVIGLKKQIAESVPLKRYGTPQEIAAAVAFLASDEASYIVGTELFVDGGSAQL